MTTFILLRHAPTEWNRDRLIQGRTDVPLSEEGAAAARDWSLPDEARAWPCLASPLERALATARAMRLDPRLEPAFTEMDWGRLEGRRLDDIRAEGGTDFADNEARGLDFRPEGGESPCEVGRRALGGLRSLDADTVVVTHKGVLRALLALATGWDMRGKAPVRLADACCHRFVLSPEGELRLIEANVPLVSSLRTPASDSRAAVRQLLPEGPP